MTRRAVRRTLADEWRTYLWATRLVQETGLEPIEVQRRLWKLRFPGEPEGDATSFFTQYLHGTTVARLVVQRQETASWVLLSERLVRGSVETFLHPAFDLFEEIELRDNPERAKERFVERINDEMLTGLRKFRDGSDADAVVQRLTSYSRLQRARLALMRLSTGMERHPFGFIGTPDGFLCVRDEASADIELKYVRKDIDALTSIGIYLAMYIEAGECDAYDRRDQIAEELDSFLESWEASEHAPTFASQFAEILRGDFERRICASYDPFEEAFAWRYGVEASVLATSSAVATSNGKRETADALRSSSEGLRNSVGNLQVNSLKSLKWCELLRGARAFRKLDVPAPRQQSSLYIRRPGVSAGSPNPREKNAGGK